MNIQEQIAKAEQDYECTQILLDQAYRHGNEKRINEMEEEQEKAFQELWRLKFLDEGEKLPII